MSNQVPIDKKILNENGEIRKLRSDESLEVVDGVLTIKRKKKTRKKKKAAPRTKSKKKQKRKKPKPVSETEEDILNEPPPPKQKDVWGQFVAPSRQVGARQQRTIKKSRVKGSNENLFNDDGSLSADLRRETKEQPVIEKASRPETPKIEVRCCVCGRTFKVHPIYAPRKWDSDDDKGTLYKCNSCVTSPVTGYGIYD